MTQDHSTVPPDAAAEFRSFEPAGFWIRVTAMLIDMVVYLPLALLAVYAMLSAKSFALYLVAAIPFFIYKPLMESRYGATLGKRALRIRVVDAQGSNLNLLAAYLRFFPWLVWGGLSVVTTYCAFQAEEFQTVTTVREMGLWMKQFPSSRVSSSLNGIFLALMLPAAYTERKQAVHDMVAGSYCVRVPAA